MTYQWRVTKYDPAERNSEGHYLKGEWVGIFELNETFGGKTFTIDDYLEVEEKYVNAAVRFFKETNEESLTLRNWQKYESGNISVEPFGLDISANFTDGQSISIDSLPVVIRMLLRDIAHCEIEIKDTFFIHIGWDFYMYIGSAVSLPAAIDDVNKSGLFVEECTSPHLETEMEI